MTYAQGLRDLVALLRAEGVEYFRDGELEVKLAPVAVPESQPRPSPADMKAASDAERLMHDDILFAAVGGAPEEVIRG